MLSTISDIQLDQEKGTVTYRKSYSVSPFMFPLYPDSKMRFCITIISPPQYLQNSKLFEFVRNAFPNFETLKNCRNFREVLNQMSDPNKSAKILSKQLGIFDLTPDDKFKNIIPDIIPTSEDISLKHLFSHQILRILVPNLVFGKFQSDSNDRSYSHTIWIASKFSELPEIIRTNSHFIFITEQEETKLYTQKYFGTEIIMAPDTIFSVCSTLMQDPQLMHLPKDRL